MADAVNFIRLYSQTIDDFVGKLIDLQTMNQQLTDDPSLLTRYFNPPGGVPPPRNDIVSADVTNAQSAIVQMLFAYNSGSPTQASYLLKMVP